MCLLLFSSLKLTRNLLDRFGDVNQFGMTRTGTGERFPSGLQGFTLGLQNVTHPVTMPLTNICIPLSLWRLNKSNEKGE